MSEKLRNHALESLLCITSFTETCNNFPDMSGLQDVLDHIRRIPQEYRAGYYAQEVVEDGEPLIFADDFGIKGEDVYGQYANLSRADLIRSKKLEGTLVASIGDKVADVSEMGNIGFDRFQELSHQDAEACIRMVARGMGFEIVGAIDEKLQIIRDALILIHNNAKLRALGISKRIRVRKEVGEKLRVANRKLQGSGFEIGVSNGLRSPDMQRVIKENHELLRGKQEADRLFASEENSPHLSGGAIDVFLMKDGKRLDLRLGDNSPATKSPLYGSEKLEDQDVMGYRYILLLTLVRAGFIVNPTEYWHFCYGDKMWAYMTEQSTGEKTVAIYGAVESGGQ